MLYFFSLEWVLQPPQSIQGDIKPPGLSERSSGVLHLSLLPEKFTLFLDGGSHEGKGKARMLYGNALW
jgi:hypothetical protein